MKPILLAAMALLLFADEAHSFGKAPTKEPQPETPPGPITQQAKPYRYMNLTHVTVPTFFFPNGERADFNVDLNQLILGQINASRYLRTQIEDPANPARLIVTGGITSFEADVLQFNFKIGWNQNGVIGLPGGNNASGEVDLRLSSLSMDFLIYDRVTKRVYMASTTDETLSNLKIQVRVNLADINGSLDLFYKQVMAKAIQIATRDIMRNLENHQNFDTLPWEAPVIGVDQDSNLVVFRAGNLEGVRTGDVYSVYSGCDPAEEAAGQCFRRFLADVRVERAGSQTAEALPLTNADSVRNVRAADKIEVKPLGIRR